MKLFKKIRLHLRKMRLLRAQEIILDEGMLLRGTGKLREIEKIVEIAEGISYIYTNIE